MTIILRTLLIYFLTGLHFFNNNSYLLSIGYRRISGLNSLDKYDLPTSFGDVYKGTIITSIIASSSLLLGQKFQPLFTTIEIPLSPFDGILCMNYTLNHNVFRGIVDTGSPFLIVPSICTSLWGCRQRDSSSPLKSNYSDTIEIYGGQEYSVEWKIGDLELGPQKFKNIVFAEVGSDIMLPPGGVFIGLIKNKGLSTGGESIRPTLLEQMDYNSFELDVPKRNLKLSKGSLIPKNSNNIIKMVDLRPLGDPIYHYAVPVKRLEINGK